MHRYTLSYSSMHTPPITLLILFSSLSILSNPSHAQHRFPSFDPPIPFTSSPSPADFFPEIDPFLQEISGPQEPEPPMSHDFSGLPFSPFSGPDRALLGSPDEVANLLDLPGDQDPHPSPRSGFLRSFPDQGASLIGGSIPTQGQAQGPLPLASSLSSQLPLVGASTSPNGSSASSSNHPSGLLDPIINPASPAHASPNSPGSSQAQPTNPQPINSSPVSPQGGVNSAQPSIVPSPTASPSPAVSLPAPSPSPSPSPSPFQPSLSPSPSNAPAHRHHPLPPPPSPTQDSIVDITITPTVYARRIYATDSSSSPLHPSFLAAPLLVLALL
ncbi:MAG: hypothetical protein DHS80DRAFT_23851 [Piptocephalis tieghemiana]|nr:MAG: hypothetical protein DHS80DRAFT_23851 [Piptocephalis tieghemiana]